MSDESNANNELLTKNFKQNIYGFKHSVITQL